MKHDELADLVFHLLAYDIPNEVFLLDEEPSVIEKVLKKIIPKWKLSITYENLAIIKEMYSAANISIEDRNIITSFVLLVKSYECQYGKLSSLSHFNQHCDMDTLLQRYSKKQVAITGIYPGLKSYIIHNLTNLRAGRVHCGVNIAPQAVTFIPFHKSSKLNTKSKYLIKLINGKAMVAYYTKWGFMASIFDEYSTAIPLYDVMSIATLAIDDNDVYVTECAFTKVKLLCDNTDININRLFDIVLHSATAVKDIVNEWTGQINNIANYRNNRHFVNKSVNEIINEVLAGSISMEQLNLYCSSIAYKILKDKHSDKCNIDLTLEKRIKTLSIAKMT